MYGYDPLGVDLDAWVEGTWTPDPEFCIGCGPGLKGFDTHDVAVIVLDTPVSLGGYIDLPVEGMSDGLKNHSPVMQVGYGVFDWARGGGAPAAQPIALSDFVRRYAPAEIITSNHVHADEFLKYTSNPAKGKGGICFGDSGGPNLYYDEETPIMLSINSYGNGLCTSVGYSYRIDTEAALGFIDSVIDS